MQRPLPILCVPHEMEGRLTDTLGLVYFPPPPATTVTATTSSTHVVHSSSPSPLVPTPFATTCPSPGVYTIPATTVILTETTTVCAATSTPVTSGINTAGGVTTVVETSTTVVCPYATVATFAGVVTSTILTTTYVCPSAGTYVVVPPMTTECSTESIWVYPTPASYPPGTYTQPEVVTTVTETDYVLFCPFATGAPVTLTSSPPAVAPPSTIEAGPAITESAPATTHTAQSSGSTGIGSSSDIWAITYTPYANNGDCKSESDVASDIALIASKGFSTVRTYSTDCSTLEFVGAACQASGLKMIVGVFISDTGISGAQDQVTAIISWAQWDLVELMVVGNEAVFNGYCSASDLAAFVSASQAAFAAAGYTGLCTTTEPLNIWQESTDVLCDVVDVVACNVHPFFNADVTCDQAGSFVSSQMSIVNSLCPGKTGINLETGWPSAGQCNGVACPGTSEQATAVAAIKAAVGGISVMFSFENNLWEAPGDFECEQSWGMIQLY